MNMKIQPILSELHRGLSALYGPRMRSLRLFGSYARNEQTAASDLDVVMVLDDFDQPWLEIQRTSELVARLSLDYDISIYLIPMRERTLRAAVSPLACNILREGIVVP
jgi:predicted nucleotidyltransferase